jgi:Holliday junction resolvase RusA-like endonuclease
VKLVLHGEPRTKKNSQRIIMAGRYPKLLPSKAYVDYEEACLWQIPGWARVHLDNSINLKCVYYMQTRRKVDLANLLEATCDILVKAGVIADDNSRIVASHDGSWVDYDKENPRVEIMIGEHTPCKNQS